VAEVADNTIVDGRYRITSRIGTGGMADVYCAHDEHLGRDVALKMLHRRFAQDQEFVERFRREASAAAGLQHANVVAVYDRGEFDGTYYIAMEFLRGRTLKELITQESPLDQTRALDITVQILRAAGFGHRRGVIHRDFKPQNVIVDDEGGVKVTDFGIARAASDHTLTETGTVIGTAHYLAPEQVSGAQATPLSDLYSVGAILYEMLGGRKPFEAETPIAVAMKRISEDPAPLRTLRKDVPEPVAAIVARALVRDPAERFASAADMRRALEEAYADVQPATLPQKIDPTPTMVLPIEEAGAAEATTAAVRPAVSEETGVGPPAAVARRRRREYKRLIAYAIVLALVVAGGTLALLALTGNGPAVVTTPNFKGGTVEQARTKAAGLGLKLRELPRDSSLPAGTVTGQSIAAGTPIGKGAEITIGVSTGNPPPPAEGSVPNVVGMTKEEAEQALKDAGFEVKQTEAQATGVDAGTVIGQYPAPGDMAQEGTQVTIVVATQPPKRHGKGRNSD
jgi:eukaryotic-like serine/threonine-protein kinase